MKEQKQEQEQNTRDQKIDQQLPANENQLDEQQKEVTNPANESQHLRTGDDKNARSGNNDTVGIP